MKHAHCFRVSGLVSEHYSEETFPPFTISLGLEPMESLPDVNLRIQVHNKWADVTDEVLVYSHVPHVLHKGKLTIEGWVFRIHSSAHGGFFRIRISCPAFADVPEWWSDRLVILSSKSRAKRARKQRRGSERSKPKRETDAEHYAHVDEFDTYGVESEETDNTE
jgi:hypothetical protein